MSAPRRRPMMLVAILFWILTGVAAFFMRSDIHQRWKEKVGHRQPLRRAAVEMAPASLAVLGVGSMLAADADYVTARLAFFWCANVAFLTLIVGWANYVGAREQRD